MFDVAIQVANTSRIDAQTEKLHISNCAYLQRIFDSFSQKGGVQMSWMGELSNALYYHTNQNMGMTSLDLESRTISSFSNLF